MAMLFMVVKEAYKKKGAQLVTNGNGKVTLLVSHFRQSDPYEASGTLREGRMDGVWQLYTPDLNRILALETFSAGNFIKGESSSLMGGDQTYTDYPRISLTAFYPNEALDFSEGESGYPAGQNFHQWEFKGKLNTKNIYSFLLDSIHGKYKYPLKDQWVIIGFKINQDDRLSDINVSSSVHDQTFNKYLQGIFANSTGWKSGIANGKKVSLDIFCSLIVKDKKIIFPSYFNDYRTQKLNKPGMKYCVACQPMTVTKMRLVKW